MNANSSVSSTGRPNSRLREVFIFSPLAFAHWWGGRRWDYSGGGREKSTYVNPKKKNNSKSKSKPPPIGTRYCLLFSGSQYSRATTTPEHVWDLCGRTTTTASTREKRFRKMYRKKNGFKAHTTAHTRKTLVRRNGRTVRARRPTGQRLEARLRQFGGTPVADRPSGRPVYRGSVFFRRVWRRRGVVRAALSTDQGRRFRNVTYYYCYYFCYY